MFPGINPTKLKGKSFNSMAFDVQILDKGKIRRTWHFEDWTMALDEMLRAGNFKKSHSGPWFRGGARRHGDFRYLNFFYIDHYHMEPYILCFFY